MQLANDASENTVKIAKPHPNASDEQASEFHSLSAHFAVQKQLLGFGVRRRRRDHERTKNADPAPLCKRGGLATPHPEAWLNHTNNHNKLSQNTCSTHLRNNLHTFETNNEHTNNHNLSQNTRSTHLWNNLHTFETNTMCTNNHKLCTCHVMSPFATLDGANDPKMHRTCKSKTRPCSVSECSRPLL